LIYVEFARPIGPEELHGIAALEFVQAPPEEVEPRKWRIVVRDADAALRELRAAFQRAELSVVDLQEHVVDFDEAFVRVIERARLRRSNGAHAAASGGPR
jgi:hypothetical protein